MMTTTMDDLATELAALEARLASSRAEVAGFEAGLTDMGRTLALTGRELEGLTRGFGGGLRRAFDGVVFDGLRLSDAMRGLARSLSDTIYAAAMRPVQTALGGMLATAVGGIFQRALPFAQGGSFAQGRVMPFASGGVVAGPVAFPMRGGTGLMGEAGPEAIMPLARGPDGRLGVRGGGSGGGRPVSVVFNIQTPDVAGFQRSQTQIAAQMSRLLAQGRRNA
jgi:phage-related minor tail protein